MLHLFLLPLPYDLFGTLHRSFVKNKGTPQLGSSRETHSHQHAQNCDSAQRNTVHGFEVSGACLEIAPGLDCSGELSHPDLNRRDSVPGAGGKLIRGKWKDLLLRNSTGLLWEEHMSKPGRPRPGSDT